MEYLEIIEENLDKIINELHEDIKKDTTIYQFVDSDFTLEKLFEIQKLLVKEYLSKIKNNNINEDQMLEFYNKIDVVYPVIYKCMSSLKNKILTYLSMYDISKEEIIEFGKKFDLFNNLLAKIYIKKDIHILQDLNESPFKKYLMYKTHIEWLNNIIKALEKDDLSIYPLIDAKKCKFNNILNYPESLMVCIDMNKCSYLHDLHTLLHKSANSVYFLYLKGEYIQAYLVFKEFKEQSLKFIATINELYFIAYSDLENAFFNFLTLVNKHKNYYVSLIDFRNLKSLNSIYGKDNITKAINIIEKKLKDFLFPKQDKCFFIRGITANFYFYACDISEEEFYSLMKEIDDLINKEILIEDLKIKMDYIIVSILIKIDDLNLSSDDIVKVLIYLKERAKKENKKLYFVIQDDDLEKVRKWLNEKYDFSYIENKLKNKEIDVVFQPIVNTYTNECEFFETLVRIKEEKKLISAGIFIDKVYEMGKITDLDILVLENIEKKLFLIKQLTDTIFVNVSFVSLLNKKYIQKFEKIFKEINIVLELTEQKMVKNLEIVENLHKKYKIVFAIDDFGSGYSSLKTVVDLTRKGVIKFLKIDGTLIQDIDKDEYLKKVTKIISILGKEMQLKVIAEFVENEKVYKILKEIKIDLSQGYYIQRPQEIELLLAKKEGILGY